MQCLKGTDGWGYVTVLNIAVGRPHPKASGHIRTMANMIFLLPQRICALIGYTMATNLKKKNNTVRHVGRKVKKRSKPFFGASNYIRHKADV